MAKDPSKKAEEQEQLIRERLNEAGGFARGAMKVLDSFFSTYQENPRNELFSKICSSIIDLNLMHLPEHRFGLAGGLAAVVALNPDLAPEWKKAFPALLSSADRLMPPIVDTSISTIGHVEYLWVWWLVARDEATLTRIIRLSHRPGEVGHMAQALLLNHSNIPRIQEVLETEGKAWAVFIQQEVVDVEVQQLAAALADDINVMCVGRQQDGKIVVVTFDGKTPVVAFTLTGGEAIFRTPTNEERLAYKQLLDEAEDP